MTARRQSPRPRSDETPVVANCVFDPPSAEISKKLVTMHSRRWCGVSPDAMANAMASGKATRPTVIPAMRSFKNLFRV